MDIKFITELIKLNRRKAEVRDIEWVCLCKDTGMSDGVLKGNITGLLESLANSNAKKSLKIKELELEVEKLKSDNKVLQDKTDTSNYTLAVNRVKNGVKIANKVAITAEAIEVLQLKGLSYDEIAKSFGVSRSTIWRHLKKK